MIGYVHFAVQAKIFLSRKINTHRYIYNVILSETNRAQDDIFLYKIF